MADRGPASSFTATESAASGYQHPFVAADDFGEARKYTALGSFLDPPTGGGPVRFAAVVTGVSTTSGDLAEAAALGAASTGSATVAGQLQLGPLGLAGISVGLSTVTGQLGLAAQLAGDAFGQSSVSGNLGAEQSVAGHADGAGNVIGLLDVRTLTALIDGSSQVSGAVHLVGSRLAGRADGETIVAAGLVVVPRPLGVLRTGEVGQQALYFRR